MNIPARIHKLKTWPVFFKSTIAGDKNFEVRLNDRDYKVGDWLCLEEYDPITNAYTGRFTLRKVKYIAQGNNEILATAIKDGYCVMAVTRDFAGFKESV